MQQPRLAGVLIPLFSMRRKTDHGIGDMTSLREWIDWAAETKVGFIQLLPVNALGRDETPSPYSAISSVALEPVYLSLEPWVIPGLQARVTYSAKDAAGYQQPAGDDLVDYPRVRSWKQWILRKSWHNFKTLPELEELRERFQIWRTEQDAWLDDFACFKVLSNLFSTDCWWQWPEQDTARARSIAHSHEDTINFEQWQQWLCFRQWESIRAYADTKDVALMGDIPIGISMASSDVFFERHLFDTSWCGGAPAEGGFADDPFTAKWGQNWGIPHYRWDEMSKDNYAWWRRRVAQTTSIFAMYRIDHILGFYRIYSFPWMPERNQHFLHMSQEQAAAETGGRLPGFLPLPDDTPAHKKQNLMRGDHYLNVLLSTTPGVRVVGEDLGCVPDYVRPNMSQLGIAGFKIPHWEITPEGKITLGSSYNVCSFATYSTHDFATIMTTWNNCWNCVQKAHQAGMLKEGKIVPPDPMTDSQKEVFHSAEQSIRLLSWFADYCGEQLSSFMKPWDDSIKNAMFKALMQSRSLYATILWTELFDRDVRLNLPGTVGGTNWRRRMNFTAFDAQKMEQSTWLNDIITQSDRDLPKDHQEYHSLLSLAGKLPFPDLILDKDIMLTYFMLNPRGGSI